MNNPKVGVIILNYKLKQRALEALRSVLKSSYNKLIPILVDNNSGDEIEKELPEGVTFIQTGQNLGYSGGNNAGIKEALKMGADFCLILNPDAEVDNGTIGKLVKASADKNIGIAGPKIYFENSKQIWYAGGLFDMDNVLGNHKGVDQQDTGQYDKIEETDFVTGAAMFVSKSVFEKIGLFDERYFLYYEDSDFCHRAKEAGFKVMYLPIAVVYHANAKTTGLGSPLQDYYITRNRMLFASKFLPFRTRFALFREGMRNLGIPARRKALFDFLIGKFGKGY